jgi:hypothetical protein
MPECCSGKLRNPDHLCNVVGIEIRQETGVAAGRDEHVAGRQWPNVHERHNSWVFVNDARLDLPGD